MKVAALDLGTNTFLCLIAEVEGGRVGHVYQDQVRLVRLGQGVNETRLFHPEALVRARSALIEFAELIRAEKPQRVLAMATSAARDVTNAAELFQICKDLDIPIQIIPGSREAQITYQGAVSQLADSARRLVVDVGGGSTELIVGRGTTYEAGQSVNLGCVRLREKFSLRGPVSSEQIGAVTDHIREHVVHEVRTLIGFSGGLDEVLAVAGTPTELARIEIGVFDATRIDGYRLSATTLDQWIEKLSARTPEQTQRDFGVDPGRADVLLPGVLLLRETLRASSLDQMKVSTRGVRYGIALEIGAHA